MKPFTSARNFTPSSIDRVSELFATAGAEELAQMLHGQVGPLCALEMLPASSATTAMARAARTRRAISLHVKRTDVYIDGLLGGTLKLGDGCSRTENERSDRARR